MIDVIIPCKSFSNSLLLSVESLNAWRVVHKIIIVGDLNDREIQLVRGKADHIILHIRGGIGIYNAMNLGLEAASSAYVYFMGDDDIVMPMSSSLEEALRLNNQKLILCRAGTYNVGNGKIYQTTLPRIRPLTCAWDFWTSAGWNHQALFVSRTAHGKFDETFELIADNVHLFGLYHSVEQFQISSDVIALFNVGGVSSRNAKQRALEWRFFMRTLLTNGGILRADLPLHAKILGAFSFCCRYVLVVARSL